MTYEHSEQKDKQKEFTLNFDKLINELFERIDYWHYKQKVNVLPANYLTKRPVSVEGWKFYQTNRVSDEQLEKWKKEGRFRQGFVIMPGKTYNEINPLYLVCIDCDEQKAIDEILSIDKELGSIDSLSKNYLVEQHDDNPNSMHTLFFSPIPFRSKAKDGIIGLEVRSNEKLLVIPAPNLHKDGCQWKIKGITDPPILTIDQAKTWLSDLDNICIKHGLRYLDQKKAEKVDSINEMIKNLKIDKNSDYRIYEGERHSRLITIANFLLHTHLKRDLSNLSKLKNFFDDIVQVFCHPSPLPETEQDRIWDDSVNHVKECNNAKSEQKGSRQDVGRVEYISEKVLEKYNLITLEETKEILYYDNGVYKSGGEILVEKEAEAIAGYDLCEKDLREIIGHISRRTYHKKTEFDSDTYIINLSNGLYNWKENKLYSHTPEYISIKQNPIVYDPKAKPKLFGKFLSQVLYRENIRTAIESMAYTFLNDCPFEHFFVLVGEGSNGKSVFTGILTALHSAANVSNVPIRTLLENNFALADLEFKDVNIDEELSGDMINDTSILKKLTGGKRQLTRVEKKYQGAYGAALYAKLFFNTNKMPQTSDQTNAFYRRLITISFPNLFEEDKDDPDLTRKLTTEFELSGIFNLLMVYLRLLVNNNRIYINDKSIAERRLKHDRLTNPIKAFLDEAMAEDSLEDDYVPKSILYNAYIRFCKKYKLPIKSPVGFGKEIAKLRILISDKETKGDRRTIWKGIRLTAEYRLDSEQVTLFDEY